MPATPTAAVPHAAPHAPRERDAALLRPCDLVMKGGITSGIVYPLAVVELSKRFRLRSIGGTSAGAIAAAAAAAAEHGRERGGFAKLEKLPDALGECPDHAGETRLASLFQAQEGTRPLYQLALALMGPDGFRVSTLPLALVRIFWREVLGGALPGLLIAAAAIALLYGFAGGVLFVVGLLATLVGVGASLFVRLRALVGTEVPKNDYGLCTGLTTSRRPGVAGLSDWLASLLDDLAGLEPDGAPLTFGQLWWPDLPAGESAPGRAPEIRLEMMTTCVSHGRPYQLPFRDTDDVSENKRFAFAPAEFERIFPRRIVTWMVEHARTTDRAAELARHGLVPLPEPWNLPVVVATRMSLSFPFLLSMVPLWVTDYSTGSGRKRSDGAGLDDAGEPLGSAGSPAPEHCWFSDGGLCSNFPVHLFDAPLPRWPTFAVNLCDARPGEKPGWFMPERNGDGILPPWNRFERRGGQRSLGGFLGALLKTMQNWNDTALAAMPGQRDRIGNVTLSPREGGLNLNMSPERIRAVSARGRDVGREFVRRFADNPPDVALNWSNHRWVRLRSLLASVVEMADRVGYACAHPEPGDVGYVEWVEGAEPVPSYEWRNEEQEEAALEVLQDLLTASKRWSETGADLSDGSPRPRPELRPRSRS